MKPENVLLLNVSAAMPRVHVSDWGLASLHKVAANQRDAPGVSSIPQDFTETMSQIGTLPYMSPERFRQSSSMPCADMYSIGMMFYELVTGSLPFLESNSAALVRDILTSAYYYRAKRSLRNVPMSPITRSFILKCLHPDASRRFRKYSAMLRHLRLASFGERVRLTVQGNP